MASFHVDCEDIGAAPAKGRYSRSQAGSTFPDGKRANNLPLDRLRNPTMGGFETVDEVVFGLPGDLALLGARWRGLAPAWTRGSGAL
jgi:hypothetical protein